MSAPDGGVRSPQTASHRPASTSSSGAKEPSAGADVPEHVSNVIDVAEASRVLECSQIERQLRFQHLVRHFLSQILHGCKSVCCTTPTCLSCQSRNASRPVRPPTQLTARALAHYLAGQDEAHRGLCPHELKVLPSSLEIDGAVGTRLHCGPSGGRQCSVYPSAPTLAHMYSRALGGHGARDDTEVSAQHDASHAQQRVVEALQERHQTRKDTKSLSQNLFDSVSMIYAYSKQLPSSASIYHTLRSASLLQPNATAPSSASDAEPQTKARDSLPAVTSAVPTNGGIVTPPVNMALRIDRQQSRHDLRARSQAHASPAPPDVLSNGQQVLRIPYHHRDSTNLSKTAKRNSQAPLDGDVEASRLSMTKSKKKPYLLDGHADDMTHTNLKTLPLKNANKSCETNIRSDPTLPVLSVLSCHTLEELKDGVYCRRKDQLPDSFNFSVDYDTNRRFQPATPFVNRSLFYTLSDPETLLKSFRDASAAFEESPLPHLDSARLTHSFRDWNRHNGALIFDSLCISLKALFTPPPELHTQKSPRLTSSRKGAPTNSPANSLRDDAPTAATKHRYLDNLEAAHIVMICIHALTSSVSTGWPHTWAQLRNLRAWGIILPTVAPETDDFMHPYLNIVDELEYEPAIRLTEHLLRAIGARTCFEHILSTIKKKDDQQEEYGNVSTLMDIVVQHLIVAEHVALTTKRRMTPNGGKSDDPGWTVTATLMEWLKTIITKRWNGKAGINKWSSVGTAVMLLDRLFMSSRQLNLREQMFEIPFFNERLDAVEEPIKFLSWEDQPNTFHILNYATLFPKDYLVKYFRTINFTSMMTQYDHTTRMHQMQGLLEKFLQEPLNWLVRNRMKVTLSDYLILNVSREQPLEDTLNQLWGLEKRMLLKPLKVKMGQHEGEIGADHGGVTYEFFRVVLSEAFKPDHGMFVLDPQTRMTWFQINTLEPDWKFEMIGILFSLAVYNGITLPVTFPLVLYHLLLSTGGLLCDQVMDAGNLDFFSDGWPDLTSGFEELLAWEDGDVRDVFVREYAFSYEAFGQRIDHNMEEPFTRSRHATANSPADHPEDLPMPKPKEINLVTNENRADFVRDYLQHLTVLSVEPQLRAFIKGFLTCLHPKSLRLFTPTTLRNLIEGSQYIEIPSLRRIARYEETYTPTHPTIERFWRVAEQLSQEDCRHLLEFVTASDRVPVTGYEGITFVIVRLRNTEMLPTSSTCFGKLYLPDYQNEEEMKRKVELAIRNSKGFGVA